MFSGSIGSMSVLGAPDLVVLTLTEFAAQANRICRAGNLAQEKNLVIAGRTSALAIANLDEAVKRAKAYEAAGVDAIFLAGGVTVEAVEVVSSAIKIPLILGGGSGQLGNLDWLAAHRVRVALQTHAPFSAAVQAVYDTLKALREGVPPRELKNIAPPELMRRVIRADDYQQWTKDFLGGA
jgi:carboxyvinyl-carboxyphosphonate phosphorylmutase